MSLNVVLLIVCLIIVSYTLGFAAGTDSEWKDGIEKRICGLDATLEKRGRTVENQTREIEVLTQDLKLMKNACLTNFEDIGNRLNELESEPDMTEITDRLNKMSDILVRLLHVEGSQGEMAHSTSASEEPTYKLLDKDDEKEDESHAK